MKTIPMIMHTIENAKRSLSFKFIIFLALKETAHAVDQTQSTLVL